MSKRLYFEYSYEIVASLLFASRFLFYTKTDGEYSRLLDKKIDYKNENRQKEYISLLLKLDEQKTIENNIYNLTQYYKNNPFLVSEATLVAMSEFAHTNNLLPAGGEWANTSDGFLHLVGYFLSSYTKEGHYLLERKEVLDGLEKITNFSHANMRVLISHTLFFALMTKLLEARVNSNGSALKKKQIVEAVDQAIRRVLHQYRDYQYLGDLRYFVRLDKQIYDHATLINPSGQIAKINAKELRAGNYVIDSVETLLYSLLRFKKYEDGLKFIADIPGFHPLNGILFTLLFNLAHGLPSIIKKDIPRVLIANDSQLSPFLERYKDLAFRPIKMIVARMSGNEIFPPDELANFASQIEFEFERIGVNISFPILKSLAGKLPVNKAEAYYQLYLLIKSTKKYDETFVGHIIIINNIINL